MACTGCSNALSMATQPSCSCYSSRRMYASKPAGLPGQGLPGGGISKTDALKLRPRCLQPQSGSGCYQLMQPCTRDAAVMLGNGSQVCQLAQAHAAPRLAVPAAALQPQR